MNAPLMTDLHLQAPEPLLPEATKPTAYPVHRLPPLLRDAALAIAEHVQAPLALASQCVLGAVTHLAQTRVNAPHLHDPNGMPCSLNMLTLALSADRKDSCHALAGKPITEKEKEARDHYRRACAEIMAEADHFKGKAREAFLAENPLSADPRTQYGGDATWEPIVGDFVRGKAAASWDTTEGGQLLGGASLKADTRTAAIGGMCLAFDTGYFERTRARGNAEGSGAAYNRRLSIHLLAQPVAVAEALADPLLRGQGFLPRFLFASPQSIAGSRLLTVERLDVKSYDDPRLQCYWARCREIIASPEYIDPETSEVTPPVLALDGEATQVWMAFYNDTEIQQGPLGLFAELRPFAGRAGEIARRVAAVLACFEGIELIDAECMSSACDLVRYSLDEWLRYTDTVIANPLLYQAAALMDWLRELKRADDWRTFHRNRLGKSGPAVVRSAKVRDKLLAVLVKHRHLLSADGKHFQVNPLAESAESAESLQPQGAALAEAVRNFAETVPNAPTAQLNGAKDPQLSANLPHAERPVVRSLPQHPQHPQPSASTARRDREPWGMEL